MKWTIELTPDGNPPITYDIGTITRPIADLSPEQIGLTLEEGQQLPRRVHVQIRSTRAHRHPTRQGLARGNAQFIGIGEPQIRGVYRNPPKVTVSCG
jgi:hypothetical protein